MIYYSVCWYLLSHRCIELSKWSLTSRTKLPVRFALLWFFSKKLGLIELFLAVELIQLTTEVLEMVQKKAGTPAFLASYEQVRKSVSKKKHERKLARKELTIQNPKKAAEIKLKKQLKKRERKKRKTREFAVAKTRVKIRKLNDPE